VSLKSKLGYDDSLDVVGVHLVGGLVGTLLIGFLASAAAPAGVDGLFYGGGLAQLWKQIIAAAAVLAYSFVVTYVIGKLIDKTMGFRISTDDEISGIDLAEHAEAGYDFSTIGGGSRAHVLVRESSDGAAPMSVDAGANSATTENSPAEPAESADEAGNKEGSVAR
jgi:ammonium transporter, Amt family